MSIMMATPAFAAPKDTNQVNSGNNKANTVIKKSKAKVGTLSKEDRALLFSMFDAEFYAKMNPDVVKLVGKDATKLFEYFISIGLKEGQQINADFNVNAYRSAYSDLNTKYGTSILSYYKHYVTEGKAEGRTITTVEKAQEQGIIVTDFGGNKMAVDESGSVVIGEQAEKVILTDKAYANAVDNIMAAELGVSPNQAFQIQKTVFIANVAAVEGDAVVEAVSQIVKQNEVYATDATQIKIVAQEPIINNTTTDKPTNVVTYNETAYQTAMKVWRRNEPKKETFSASYNEEKAQWQAEKPVRSDYDIETRYATKAQAEAAYNTDYTNWANSVPKAEDYMTSAEKTNFENAKLSWENAKPQREAFIVTLYDTEAKAKAAYRADYAEWESNAPKRSDYVVGNYRTKEDAKVAFENDLREWETNEPKLTDAKYSVGNYTSDEAAQSEYNYDYTAWQSRKPSIDNGDYTVGNYDTQEEADEAWRIAVEEHARTEPKDSDYVYYENTYSSVADAKAHYDAALANYNAYVQWENTDYSDVNTVYLVNGTVYAQSSQAVAAIKESCKPNDSVTEEPKADDIKYAYNEAWYASESAAQEVFNADCEKYQKYDTWVKSSYTEYAEYLEEYAKYKINGYNYRLYYYSSLEEAQHAAEEFGVANNEANAIFKVYYSGVSEVDAREINKESVRKQILPEIRDAKKPDDSVKEAPNFDDDKYKYNIYSSAEDAENAYNEDCTLWNAYNTWNTHDYEEGIETYIRYKADGVDETFASSEAASAAKKEACKPAVLVTTQPRECDYQYYKNKYSSQAEATDASEAAKCEYVNSTPKLTDYNVGKYRTNDEATAQFNLDYLAWEAEKPVETDEKYSVGNFKTVAEAEAKCEIDHENFVNNNGQKPTEDDGKYSVGYDSETTAQVQYDGDRATYEQEKPEPVEADYTYGGYTDENAANQAYESAVEDYISGTPAPKLSDYVAESAEQYNSAHGEWSGNEPIESDYTYPTAELKAQADANYNAAVSEWENSEPSFDGNLSESENASYEEAHNSWEESEPNHEDYKN